ncbi:MAG: hypothetical protein SOT46_00900 [Treponema sp.]|nr:hypothetical protein [Spirochaetia bacterium]MDY2838912.1 hypothetical protein [Treponema sp.]MDY5123336.1 hypothetical protein [Treponema sp.]
MKNVNSAMNFIPSTFDEHQIRRTVIGGIQNESPSALNISVVILNGRASHFKYQIFDNLLTCNFKSIVSIEHNRENFAIDDITKRYPEIKFIIPLEEATDGEMINIAMSEVDSDYVLVIRDSLYIPSGIILPHLAEKLLKDNIYCVIPRLLDVDKSGLPCHSSPTAVKNSFKVDVSISVKDGEQNLYPYDFIGIYNRQKFIQLGGYDYTIQSPYWQNLDLAIRSWLWGEETRLTTLLQFNYTEETSIEDQTVNIDYLRYYLKNELPKMKMGAGVIRRIDFLTFYFHSSCGFLEARRQFNAAKNWVKENKYRFKTDLPNFVASWGKEK